MCLFDPSSGGIPEGGNRCSVCPKDGGISALIPLPCAQHLADVDGVDAGFEAVVPLLRGPVAEVLSRLVPGRHGLALHYHAGLLVVGVPFVQAIIAAQARMNNIRFIQSEIWLQRYNFLSVREKKIWPVQYFFVLSPCKKNMCGVNLFLATSKNVRIFAN